VDPSEFTLRLLLLFLPGIITRLMIERLTVPHDKSQMYFFLHAFISGVFAYALYAMVLSGLSRFSSGLVGNRVYFVEALLDSKNPLSSSEVAYVCVIAAFNGFALSAAINRKFLNRFAQRIGVTKKFGDLDVWSYLHNSTTDSLRWIRVRDNRHDLCYEGWVEAFSDTAASNEIFLREVRVFANASGEHLYDVPGIYLSQDPQDIAIEFYASGVRESSQVQEGGNACQDQTQEVPEKEVSRQLVD
jgi:hypothetical protein